MERLQENAVEFGKWRKDKYSATEIFKAVPGISVSAKAIGPSEFTVNVVGKDLGVYIKDIKEAKKEALLQLRMLLEEALNNIKEAEKELNNAQG